jgi:hypothetical protein
MRMLRLRLYCSECGQGPTEVEYELLDGPNKGIYRYCERCAIDLGLVISVSTTAEYLDVNESTVRSRCRSGKLKAFQNDISGRWWIMTDPHFGGVKV